MNCTRPIPALQKDPGGSIQLHPPIGTANLAVPCTKCLGCRRAKAAEWGLRAEHEARQWEHNVFITPTYDDAHLPENGDLQPSHFTNLIKRLRIRRTRHPEDVLGDHAHGLKYLGCGEYGERGERPHLHALLFNAGFPDLRQVGTKNGRAIYESDILTSLWTDQNGEPLGIIRAGIPDPGAAGGYVGKYTLKNRSAKYYVDRDGVEHPPQFIRMSRRPMIGAAFLEKYSGDLTYGYVVQNGRKRAIPRSYKKKLDPAFADEIAGRLAANHRAYPSDKNHPDRLAAQEIINQQAHELSERRRSL